MAKRRANGEESIRKRSDGRWEGRYTAGRDLVTGKPIYKNVLGEIPLEKLTAMELQWLYKHLLESGRVESTEARNKPKGLSVKTVRNINQIISSALNCAVEQRLISSNPTKGCVLPKLEKKEMKILPPESLGTFFEEARRSGVFEMYYLDLATGLRRGELLGLKWSDIDLGKGVIHVRRQILRQNGRVVEAFLKTKNSYRNIAIGADAIEVLRSMKHADDYVFPSPYGGPMSPDSVLHMLQRVLKRAGLDRIRFHDLRHILGTGAPERCGRENTLLHAGPLLHSLHPGHLCPCHHFDAEAGGECGRQLPLRCSPALTAPGFSMGHGLGQTTDQKSTPAKKCREQKQSHRNSTNFGGFGTP